MDSKFIFMGGSMKNEKMDYIKNNDKIILMYENLYKKGVDIDKLKILFKKNYF